MYLTDKNILIKKRRRRKKLKRGIITTIFLVSLTLIVLFTLPIFKLEKIEVKNNVKLTSDDIVSLSNIKYGTNLFRLKLNDIEETILKNSYVNSVKINKVLPNKLLISIEERNPFYFGNINDDVYIIDKNGFVMDKLKNNPFNDAINIVFSEGVTLQIDSEVKVPTERDLEILKEISDLILRNNSDIKITKIDVSDFTNIIVYVGDMKIILGNAVNLKDKLNLSFNIFEENNLRDRKGYIDVSSYEKPVFHVE